MCGLAGYINFNNISEQSNKIMLEMLRLQQHRGPDDSGIVSVNTRDRQLWQAETKHPADFAKPANLVLGFNRLSILDLSANGHQPMLAAEGKVALMLNGEIYNAFDYKKDLEHKGYQFKSHTDTEVVLCLYLEYGFDTMIKMLNGMFAIVLLDLRNDILFLARDRFGIKPLYVLSGESRLAFSSEMKSFKALPNFKFELDDSRLDEYLLFRNLINHTLFKNIENLVQGTYQSININSGTVSTNSFYSIDEEGLDILSVNSAYNELESALKNSVKRQMISDVKLGAQLSGGVDSSLVTYYATNHVSNDSLETVSVVLDNQRYSEEKYIDVVVNQLGLNAHKFNLQEDYYFREIEKATWHFEQPLNHPNTIGIYLLSEQAKKHVTVLLSGEGADESLAGYNCFIEEIQNPYFSRHFLGKLSRNRRNLIEYLGAYRHHDSRIVIASAFGSIKMAKRLRPSFSIDKAIAKRVQIFKNLQGTINLKQRKYEILTYLPDLLMRQDKMSMAHSIENRVPFLDNEMVSTSLNIPDKLLVNYQENKPAGKVLLKNICSDKFGKEFAFRGKKGFPIPLKDFMSSDLFQQKWHGEIKVNLKERAIFNTKYASNAVENISKATQNDLEEIWMLTTFEIWASQYLNN